MKNSQATIVRAIDGRLDTLDLVASFPFSVFI